MNNRGHGENGKRNGLKIRRANPLGGSIPPARIYVPEQLTGIRVVVSKYLRPLTLWQDAYIPTFYLVSEDVFKMMKEAKDDFDWMNIWRLCNEKN